MAKQTLTDVKRSVVVGTRIEVLDHWQPQFKGTIRRVETVQLDGYYFRREAGRGFCYWHKAEQVTFHEDGSFTTRYQNMFWRLRILGTFQPGDKVHANGFDGVIERVYEAPTRKSCGMFEVRLPGGVACVPGSDILSMDEYKPGDKITPENVKAAIEHDNAPFQKFLDIHDANSSGQGTNPCHAENPHHDALVDAGWEYSHTTSVKAIDGSPFALHTYRLPGTDWVIGVYCRPGWKATASRLGSGRETVYFGTAKLAKYAKRKATELRRGRGL